MEARMNKLFIMPLASLFCVAALGANEEEKKIQPQVVTTVSDIELEKEKKEGINLTCSRCDPTKKRTISMINDSYDDELSDEEEEEEDELLNQFTI